MSVPFALSSAAAYGAGDFAGGLAARRTPVLIVTAVAQAAGLVALLPAALLVSGHLSPAAVGIGVLAGVSGMVGLLLYMRGPATGPMGLVAPLSSVVGAGLPLVAGVLGGERPGGVARPALAVALVAIVLAGVGSRGNAAAGAGTLYGLGAGVGFGLFFVAVAATPDGAGLWPLAAGRVVSVTLLSGVLVSLYPVVVILLARFVLRERLTGLQLASVGLALTATALLAV